MTLSAMTRYLIPSILLALIAVLFITLRPGSNSGTLQANGQWQSPNPGMESTNTETGSANNFRTKSKNRIYHPKPTLEETVEFLKSTVIPKADFQDQPLSEVTTALNIFIKDAGIPPHKLKVIINSPELFAQLRIRELRVRNIPLTTLLSYICGNTKIRYRVEPGIVRILSATEIPPDPPTIETSNDSPDPFEILPAQESDPFAEPNSSAQDSDPFAEPEVPSQP